MREVDGKKAEYQKTTLNIKTGLEISEWVLSIRGYFAVIEIIISGTL